jgi:hypothetical protein
MKNSAQKPKYNTFPRVVWMLTKDYLFWWNLIAFVAIAKIFFSSNMDSLSCLLGCIGILNLGCVIMAIVQAIKPKRLN